MNQELKEAVDGLLQNHKKLIALLEGRSPGKDASEIALRESAAPLTEREAKLKEVELDRMAARQGIRTAEGKRIWREGRQGFDHEYNSLNHGAKGDELMRE